MFPSIRVILEVSAPRANKSIMIIRHMGIVRPTTRIMLKVKIDTMMKVSITPKPRLMTTMVIKNSRLTKGMTLMGTMLRIQTATMTQMELVIITIQILTTTTMMVNTPEATSITLSLGPRLKEKSNQC